MANTYPHMCRDGHDEVGFRGDDERCPACRARDEVVMETDRQYDLTRAVSDLWREIASVAGLALWVNALDHEAGEFGYCKVNTIFDLSLDDLWGAECALGRIKCEDCENQEADGYGED